MDTMSGAISTYESYEGNLQVEKGTTLYHLLDGYNSFDFVLLRPEH